jgi:hypothetical protein
MMPPGQAESWSPWVELDEKAAACRKRAVSGDAESTGTGALIVLGLLAWAIFEADRRVPR